MISNVRNLVNSCTSGVDSHCWLFVVTQKFGKHFYWNPFEFNEQDKTNNLCGSKWKLRFINLNLLFIKNERQETLNGFYLTNIASNSTQYPPSFLRSCAVPHIFVHDQTWHHVEKSPHWNVKILLAIHFQINYPFKTVVGENIPWYGKRAAVQPPQKQQPFQYTLRLNRR